MTAAEMLDDLTARTDRNAGVLAAVALGFWHLDGPSLLALARTAEVIDRRARLVRELVAA